MAEEWVLARKKKSADKAWTSTVSVEPKEFIEMELGFEEEGHRQAVLVAGKASGLRTSVSGRSRGGRETRRSRPGRESEK